MGVLVKSIFKNSAKSESSYEGIAAMSCLWVLQGDMEDHNRHNYAFSSQCTRLFCDEEAPNGDVHNIDIPKHSTCVKIATYSATDSASDSEFA